MKKLLVPILCGLCLLALAFPALAADSSAINAARLAKRAVAAVPAGVKARRVAVYDFKGDTGALYNALSAAVQKDRRFELVERKLLDNLLKEQGLQVSDIASREHRVKFGQIKGVQAIFMGEVTKLTANLFWNEISAHVRLVDVQTGQVLMSGNFSAGGKTRLLVPVAAGAAALLLLILLVVAARAAKRKRAQGKKDRDHRKAVDTDHQAMARRRELLGKLEAARGDMQDAARHLEDSGQQGPAQRLRRLRTDLDSLNAKVKAGRWGAPGADQKTVDEFDKKMAGYFGEIADDGRALREAAQHGSFSKLSQAMDALESKVADLKGRLSVRP